ncbi:MAG: hypothetical protein QM572_05615 [Nocardioides sp.]|uniref:hypothetical protein n=1 Tax=Nocardioides sp. TaxID=35761 RepID=UPI0039E70118
MMTNARRPGQLKLAFAAVAAAGAVLLLSGCGLQGFDYATDRPNTIANGAYHTSGDIHIGAARIIAAAPGSGTFVATITTDQHLTEAVTLTSISGLSTVGFKPIEVEPASAVNLYTEGGITVTGSEITAGAVLPVTLSFSDGSTIDVSPIVVTQCHDYASPSAAATVPADDSSSEAGEAYSCEYASVPPLAE